jgi:hypothetical protein
MYSLRVQAEEVAEEWDAAAGEEGAVETADLFVKSSDQPMKWTLLHVGMMWRKYLETSKVHSVMS